MEDIKEFINSFFQTTIKPVEYGFRCSFITEDGEEGYVILKKGKNKWNTKPVMNSPYVITESNMVGVLRIIDTKFKIDENDYNIIKDEINKRIELTIKEFDEPVL